MTTFETIKEKDLFKENFDSPSDPTMTDFHPLTCSNMYRTEFRENEMEWEYISSFVEAANYLLHAIPKRGPGCYVFTSSSIPLVITYLVRHSIELAIKKATKELGEETKNIHRLCSLWNNFECNLSHIKTEEHQKNMNSMRKFIAYVDKIDNTGTTLRYALASKGKLSVDKFLFVNCKRLVAKTQEFVNCLKELIRKLDKEKLLKK